MKFNGYDFQYNFDVEYDRSTCSGNCSEWPGICRCTKIENVRLGFRCKTWEIVERKFDLPLIDKYSIERILTINKFYDVDNFYVKIQGGYYGEETREVTFNEGSIVDKQIDEVLQLKDIKEKISYLLNLEYGYLLDSKYKGVVLDTAVRNKIIFGQERHRKNLSKEVIAYYEGYPYPRGILYKNHVVDGYHRLSGKDSPVLVWRIR